MLAQPTLGFVIVAGQTNAFPGFVDRTLFIMPGVSQIMIASAVAIWYILILPLCIAVSDKPHSHDPDTAEEPVIGIDLGTTYSV